MKENKQIELDVDVIGAERSLTPAEQKKISEFIRKNKLKRTKPKRKVSI